MTDKHDEAHETAADASPAKRFFIYMLVKDIELIPSVVDLVDNSVDAARIRLEARLDTGPAGGRTGDATGNPPTGDATPENRDLTGYWVKLVAGPDRFEISDNCGGLPLDMAERYAFRFGRPEDFPGSPLAVGQFGVGMKRALFKLGTQFTVSSVTDRSRFVLPVNVEEWARDLDPRWRFVFSMADPEYSPADGEKSGPLSRSTGSMRASPKISRRWASLATFGSTWNSDISLRSKPAWR